MEHAINSTARIGVDSGTHAGMNVPVGVLRNIVPSTSSWLPELRWLIGERSRRPDACPSGSCKSCDCEEEGEGRSEYGFPRNDLHGRRGDNHLLSMRGCPAADVCIAGSDHRAGLEFGPIILYVRGSTTCSLSLTKVSVCGEDLGSEEGVGGRELQCLGPP